MRRASAIWSTWGMALHQCVREGLPPRWTRRSVLSRLHRDAAHTNADTYVVALCVLAFASLALLGFYPIYSARIGDAATAPTQAIACENDAKPLAPSRGAKITTTCR